MAYISSATILANEVPQLARAIPASPGVLEDLAKASSAYAAAADRFIAARDELTDARQRWQDIRDEFAKVSEAEGV